MPVTSLRVMFLNTENLFSPGVQIYGKGGYSQTEYDAKIDWISKMVATKQVHFVGLTEIGDNADTCLDDIMTAVNALDSNNTNPFQYRAAGNPQGGNTKIRNAVISRFPLSNSDSMTDFPAGFSLKLFQQSTSIYLEVPYYKFSRPVFKTTVNLPNGKNINLFVVHLKSKRPNKSSADNHSEINGITRSAIQRNMEAAALRTYLDTFLLDQYNADPEVPSILVGDFNDTPNSVVLENIRGKFDPTPGAPNRWSEHDKKRLLNCARLHLKFAAYEDKLYSYIHNETFSLIDQGFVTQHLVSKFKRMEMYNDHVFRHTASAVTIQEQQWRSTVSDHGAFVLEFVRVLS